MFPGINQKQLEKAMKRMGVKQEQIDAKEVVIKCSDKNLIIRDPQVSMVNMMGQESLQITGEITEEPIEKFTKEDIEMVIQQTGCSETKAKKVLEESNGDIAEAILSLKDNKS